MRKAQKQKAFATTVPPPVGGWNARDALGSMAPTDAVYLTNWFPGTTSVMQRHGYSQYATGMVNQVETIMNYSGGASSKMFGIAGGKIYNASTAGVVGAAAVSGLTNSRFQYINVATSGGNFLMAANGADKLQGYNGTAWYVDGDGSHDITGVNTNTIIGLNLHKNRVWMVQKDTLNVWYLPTSAIAGAATAFPLQGVATMGGYVMAMATWTIDAGSGVDDMAVFVTNMGQVIVYAGTDPSSANTWALKGVWNLGAPIGRRCFVKYGGDVLLICQDGLSPLSIALQSDRLDQRAQLTDKIQSAVSDAVTLYGTNYGWQVIPFPKQNMLVLNVPVIEGNSQQQFVMNAITKSWCNFTGWGANCFELFNDSLYFGGNGFIGKAWDTLSDNGAAIQTNGKQAFNYYGGMEEKRFTLIRPTMLSNGIPTALCSVDVNLQDIDPTGALSYSGVTYAAWDAALWDLGTWGGAYTIIRNWQGVTGLGSCAAIRLKTAAIEIEVQWVATDIVMEKGSIL